MVERSGAEREESSGAERKEALLVTDKRTGKTYEISIIGGAIRATDLKQIKVDDGDPGLISYDPAYLNTACCRSAITFIDGDRGILRYRGYPIEELAEHSTYLETAYLLIHGELPTRAELEEWTEEIRHHTMIHENIKKFMDGFNYDAHPMGMLVGTLGALSTFYPEARDIQNPVSRHREIVRLIAKMPTLAAFAYRHLRGLPYVYPDNELSYIGNFLNMMWKVGGDRYTPDPLVERSLDVIFILHADHEQNLSTHTMRVVGSSRVDPYSAMAAATAALYGPLHGGANEAVVRMLQEIGSPERVPAYLERVKRGEIRLMGFGHRIYKSYDPRAKVLKGIAEKICAVTRRNPLLDVALELERQALEDEYFIRRRLYPNVDFYSGLIFQALGFPVEMFPVLFAIPRTSGWLAHWNEMLEDPEQKIARPRQIYSGPGERPYLPLAEREGIQGRKLQPGPATFPRR